MSEQTLPDGTPRAGATRLEAPGLNMDRWWLLVVAIVGIIALLAIFIPDPFRRALVFMISGIWVSIGVTLASFFLVVILGLFGGLGRLSKNRLIHGAATLYVEVVRGIPLMVQILFWYFAFPAIIQSVGESLNLAPLITYRANGVLMAILGLTICYAAYMSEIYRAGIQSISKGQMEAARSLGMTSTQALRYVILPQAIRVILPPMGNEFISLLKDSSLISVVAVADLTRLGREFSSKTATPIETWSMVALLYLVMTTLAARIVAYIERKTKLG